MAHTETLPWRLLQTSTLQKAVWPVTICSMLLRKSSRFTNQPFLNCATVVVRHPFLEKLRHKRAIVQPCMSGAQTCTLRNRDRACLVRSVLGWKLDFDIPSLPAGSCRVLFLGYALWLDESGYLK